MNLLFRADASVRIGTGHAMRCLALAQAWQDAGGGTAFAMAESTAALTARLSAESCEIHPVTAAAGTEEDARQTIALAREQQSEWIVVDGYPFTGEYQRALKAEGFKILFLDDYGHAAHYSSDLVLNQNVSAEEKLYANREAYTELLLGPRYCLLRREFAVWRDWKRQIRLAGRCVLVMMGGSDPENLTTRVMEALALVEIEDLEATVVVGGSSPYYDLLSRQAVRSGRITVRRDVTDVAEWMSWADAAVSSAGTTCWEICLLALPAVLIAVAANQAAVAQELGRQGCVVYLGETHDFSVQGLAEKLQMLLGSVETRRTMSLRSRELVDGKGAERVVSIMRAGLRLRAAKESDSRLLWEWANDARVRAAAFSMAPIPWEQHEVWFAGKMKDPRCHILVAEDDQCRALGQFRVDWRSEHDGEIDVSVSSQRRGGGLGAVLIELGASRAFAEGGGRLHAFVKSDNVPSCRAFEQAGFASIGEETVHGQPAIHYVCSRARSTSRSE